ncbi:MAG: 50S ribosomal protein L35 [Candidatus Aminicenantes bacterium]|nr:50S ribosomal protein L35 [Candidatus Aminicenantes bacterium]RLE03654.1 MAG: 50S ribosomal protein L35 [Candidatus Aminicenantes bacterium]RLE03703.1 MAG: 50S ribosomal protein L35 [Candidatus Aminicenantes bacterium]HHF43158.1 50S ribosomal protein L35 [Candidatus Aminicenantes bacterium]
MPKLKTHRGAKKRFKVTAKKKILHQKSNKSHILTKKSAKRKRNLGKLTLVSKVDKDKVKKMLPYAF